LADDFVVMHVELDEAEDYNSFSEDLWEFAEFLVTRKTAEKSATREESDRREGSRTAVA
jgi:hypothetical protein